MITVERLDSFDSIESNEWNHSLAGSATSTIFQTYQWQRTWWEHFRSDSFELILLVARELEKTVGIAAIYVDQHRVARFVGHGRSDYSDLICPPERDDVRAALLRRLAVECSPWKRMVLRHIPAESPTGGVLLTSGVRMLHTDVVPCPTLLIAGHQLFFDQARTKKSLRRHHNYFSKQDGYRVEHFRHAKDILPLLDDFFAQHIARWSGTKSASLFSDETNRQFFRAITRSFDTSDALRFTCIWIGDRPIAFHFGFVFAGTFLWYKPSFDPALAAKSPGEALLKELFELASEEQLGEFDFTIGAEAFKQRFASHTRYNQEITLYRHAADFYMQWFMRKAKRFAKRLAGK